MIEPAHLAGVVRFSSTPSVRGQRVGAVKKLEFLAAGGYGVPQVVSGVISIGACRLMPAGCAGGRRAMRQSRIGSNSTSQQRVARDREMNGREERETEIALGPPTTTHHRPRSRNRLYEP